jgi:hypothetical protein
MARFVSKTPARPAQTTAIVAVVSFVYREFVQSAIAASMAIAAVVRSAKPISARLAQTTAIVAVVSFVYREFVRSAIAAALQSAMMARFVRIIFVPVVSVMPIV